MKIIEIERKSNLLTPSSLPCLGHIPTINITAGCAHQCLYCYGRGYSTSPGGESVHLYSNLLERLKVELPRKRRQPDRVYFCPSCDAFQPIPAVRETTVAVMEFLLASGVAVAFLTKGRISRQCMKLFGRYPQRVYAQIGLISLDQDLLDVLEPGTATAEERLKQMDELACLGINVSARLDPIFPGLTDTNDQLSALFRRLRKVGIGDVAISYLFLRPRIKAVLAEQEDDDLVGVLNHYEKPDRLYLNSSRSRINALPAEFRRANYQRITRLAESLGLHCRICGCKNHDITDSTCHIAGPPQ
ncbi:MAG: hypothetical protein KAV00_01410, partial [Phycisphaerae bacterium]|nr:hypothetical protein [Phycisphaerae bacterium]